MLCCFNSITLSQILLCKGLHSHGLLTLEFLSHLYLVCSCIIMTTSQQCSHCLLTLKFEISCYDLNINFSEYRYFKSIWTAFATGEICLCDYSFFLLLIGTVVPYSCFIGFSTWFELANQRSDDLRVYYWTTLEPDIMSSDNNQQSWSHHSFTSGLWKHNCGSIR